MLCRMLHGTLLDIHLLLCTDNLGNFLLLITLHQCLSFCIFTHYLNSLERTATRFSTNEDWLTIGHICQIFLLKIFVIYSLKNQPFKMNLKFSGWLLVFLAWKESSLVSCSIGNIIEILTSKAGDNSWWLSYRNIDNLFVSNFYMIILWERLSGMAGKILS